MPSPPPPPPIENPLTESPSSSPTESRFSNLRGVQWRIYLGILPSSSSSSIEDHRRVTADSRRRYASLRRRLLVDPHLPKDGNRSPDPVMDNPLSQSPDSMWGRFFRNAELERTLDQDLSRLYPEHGSYFQTPACQAMLRRILLLWCVRHPEYGYRQGMHELLAPLLYVLHVDIQRYSEVRKKYENYFTDEFDGTSFPESDVISNYRFAKSANWDGVHDGFQGSLTKASSVDDLDLETRDIILLSDAYGAEGELGILLSERFMEHDAYCMFDALMNGAHGVVAMADFFSPSPPISSSMSLPPVIEASSALYHLLSIVDSSLHSHLVELGVEPQYFAMRWLRVLFGREFSLKDLLIIWDEVFSSPNGMCYLNAESDLHPNFNVLSSSRGAFISAMAVTMILHLRSSLLATEHATSCLQKLLNFPENIDVKKLIGKAKSLQPLALDVNVPVSPSQGTHGRNMLPNIRENSLSSGVVSPKSSHYPLPESYWEKQWRVLHKEEESQKGTQSKSTSNGIIKGFRRARLSLSRTESDPSPAKSTSFKRDPRSSVRRSLLDDLSQEADPVARPKEPQHPEAEPVTDHTENSGNDFTEKSTECKSELICSSGENSGFSTASSPLSVNNNCDNDSDESSVTSNSCVGENDEAADSAEAKTSCCNDLGATLPATTEQVPKINVTEKDIASKEKKILPGKFQWFWRFGRGDAEGNLEKVGNINLQKSTNSGDSSKDTSSNSASEGHSRAEAGDKKVVGTLRNLGHSMLENIQVIESVLQQEFGPSGSLENLSSNILGGKGQATAMSALNELRKISNLLSEV